ncbi:MAG: 30S ribosomal protein S20 [Planctomycetota bacterium]
MPNTKSAAKRLRQTKVRQARNKSVKSELRTRAKKVMTAVKDGDIAGAEEAYKAVARRLDQAGAKRVIHPNAAARRKSRLQNAIKSAKSSG